MHPVFKFATPGTKIAILFLLLCAGLIVSLLFMGLMNIVFGINYAENNTAIYISSALQSLFAIALPSFTVATLTTDTPNKFFKLGWNEKMLQRILFALLLFLLSYPFVSFLTKWNSGMQLPVWMSGIEAYMRTMEDAAMETTMKLLSAQTPLFLIFNLVVVAGLAAFSEELFFRGALQQFLYEKFRNEHAPVWISAFLFSLIHFQFFGFLPRMMLGVILGYLFYYSRNLWIAIIFHFVNNATVIVLYYFWSNAEWFRWMEEYPVNFTYLLVAIISAILTFLLFRNYMKHDRLLVEDNETLNR